MILPTTPEALQEVEQQQGNVDQTASPATTSAGTPVAPPTVPVVPQVIPAHIDPIVPELLKTQQLLMTQLLTRQSETQSSPIAVTKHRLKLPEVYDDKRDAEVIDRWLFAKDTYVVPTKLDANDALYQAISLITKDARTWWSVIEDDQSISTPSSWEPFKSRLDSEFLPKDAWYAARAKLHNLTQKGSVAKYANEFRSLLLQIGNSLSQKEAVFHFVHNLKDNTRKHVQGIDPATLEEAIQVAERYDHIYHPSQSEVDNTGRSRSLGKRSNYRRPNFDRTNATGSAPMHADGISAVDELLQKYCFTISDVRIALEPSHGEGEIAHEFWSCARLEGVTHAMCREFVASHNNNDLKSSNLRPVATPSAPIVDHAAAPKPTTRNKSQVKREEKRKLGSKGVIRSHLPQVPEDPMVRILATTPRARNQLRSLTVVLYAMYGWGHPGVYDGDRPLKQMIWVQQNLPNLYQYILARHFVAKERQAKMVSGVNAREMEQHPPRLNVINAEIRGLSDEMSRLALDYKKALRPLRDRHAALIAERNKLKGKTEDVVRQASEIDFLI